MANRDTSKSSIKSVSLLRPFIIFGYAVIIIIAITVVSQLAIRKTDTVLKNKVTSMTASLNVQMKLNINTYLQRMETIGTLVFASDEAYTYDATDESNDEYEALETEKVISDKLYSLCIMENFVDYGIVYRNNRTIGKISNGTIDQFGDTLFTDLSAIAVSRTNDGWAAGFHGNFKRIYYVKKIHENAVLVISFYSSELEDVFDNPEKLNGMAIRLANQDSNIIYSSVADTEVGTALPKYIAPYVKSRKSATVMNDDYLVTVNGCADNWFVTCSIPTNIILHEKNEVYKYIILTAMAAALLAILIGALLSLRLTDPVKEVVTSLDSKAHIDQLTGILNKKTFEEFTEKRIQNSLATEDHALILLDLDNFKGVNDTLGHAYGDSVLANVGKILRQTFTSEDFLGRIGGDEFCVFINSTAPQPQSYEEFVKARCDELSEAFHNNYTGDDGKYKISASIGVSMFSTDISDFSTLYAASDKALYRSKKSGKDTYTFYKKEMEADKT